MKTFNTGTRYDLYVIQKQPNNNFETQINDITGQSYKIKLSALAWLPNSDYDAVSKIISKYPKYNETRIICNSSYHSDNGKWVSDKKTNLYKYILIHSTVKYGGVCMYSSRNDLGHFGIPKVIFDFGGVNTPVLDIKGLYGMTQATMAIPIKDKKDGIQLIHYLMSDKFKVILKACLYSVFMIDWRVFAYFKDGFWRSKISSNKWNDKPLSCIQKKTTKK